MLFKDYIGADWLEPGYDLNTTKEYLDHMLPIISDLKETIPFDTLALIGYSGIAIGTLVSWHLKIPVIAVRKEMTHDSYLAFGYRKARRVVLIDDFISSGETAQLVFKRINDFCGAKLVAVLCYRWDKGVHQETVCVDEKTHIPIYGIKPPEVKWKIKKDFWK